MTRIVAGSAKGRTLAVPKSGTRPTSERVREALFSRLDHMNVLNGTVVLDLYAGTGAPVSYTHLDVYKRQGVDRVVLTGSYDTARLFRSWKPDMHLLGETSGKNAIIVTPSADPDLAVRDIVHSAFAHAGQKCSASSLLILVGSAGRASRIARQLVDATASLRVGRCV